MHDAGSLQHRDVTQGLPRDWARRPNRHISGLFRRFFRGSVIQETESQCRAKATQNENHESIGLCGTVIVRPFPGF
jgi:hypothetical protein